MMKTRSGNSYALNGDFIVLKLKGMKVQRVPYTHKKGSRLLIVSAQPSRHARHRGTKPRKTQQRKGTRMRVTRVVRRARRSLAQRFVLSKQKLDPSKTLVAGLGVPILDDVLILMEKPSKTKELRSKLDKLVGYHVNPAAKKRLIRVGRSLFNELGIAVVGRIPHRMLEIIWEHVGERLLAPHGPNCWCVVCRSSDAVHTGLVQRLGDSLWYYVRQMPVRELLKTIVLAPIRTARYVANMTWRWLNILLDDKPAGLLDVFCGCKITEEEFATLSYVEIGKLVADRSVEDAESKYDPDGWVVRLAAHMRRHVHRMYSGSS